MTSARVVVIGVGNPFRGDDAAGIEVARLVGRSAPDRVRVVEHEGEASGLIEHWDGAALALVADAVRSGAAPGTVHRLEVGSGAVAIAGRAWQLSSHALGLGEAIELARALGRLPGRLVLVGIEAAAFEAGSGLSAPVAHAVGQAARMILDELAGADVAR